MYTLSRNAKESIKISLAVTICYYITLRYSWLSSSWCAIAVVFISRLTEGQSFGRGLQRMAGTLVAFVMGLFFIGLFPQDRWLFWLSLSPFLAFVTYKVQGKGGQYFWFVLGFVTLMITTSGSGTSEHAFEYAAFRTLETAIGIMVWTLISVFIWPRTARSDLKQCSQALLVNMQAFMHNYHACIMDQDSYEELKSNWKQNGKLRSQFEQTLDFALSESNEIRENRHLWKRLDQLSMDIAQSMNGLQLGYANLQGIDLEKVLPRIQALFSEFEFRFKYVQSVTTEGFSPYTYNNTSVTLSDKHFHPLDHFQRAAVQLTKNELDKLDALTRSMVACISEIAGYKEKEVKSSIPASSNPAQGLLGLPVLDPDRVRGSIMVVASMWFGALIWIYVNPPGGTSWYYFIPNITLIAVQTPFVKLNIAKLFFLAYMFALAIYIFILPQISTFLELGSIIFLFSAVACYVYPGMERTALFLGMFNILGIENQQNYDVAGQANVVLFTVLALFAVYTLTYITRSPRQEKAFLSMMSRYFRSCEFLVSYIADAAPSESLFERVKLAYYRQELRSLPVKLVAWGGQIDKKKYPNTSIQQILDMLASLQILSYRIEELMAAHKSPQAAILTRGLRDDMCEWRIVIEKRFRKLSDRPEAELADALRGQLSARLRKVNTRIEATFSSIEHGKISEQESRGFYQLLGCFQGLSQAVIAYADTASVIDWEQWREERF